MKHRLRNSCRFLSGVLFLSVAICGAAEESCSKIPFGITEEFKTEGSVNGKIRLEWNIPDGIGLRGSVSGRGFAFMWRTFGDGGGIEGGTVGLSTPIGVAGTLTAEGLYRDLWLPEPQGGSDPPCLDACEYRVDRSAENTTRVGLSVPMVPGIATASFVLDPDDYALAGIHADIPLSILGELTTLSAISRIYDTGSAGEWFLPAGGSVPDDLLYLGGRWRITIEPFDVACMGVFQSASDAPPGGFVGGCMKLTTPVFVGVGYCAGVSGGYRLPDGDLGHTSGHWVVAFECIPRAPVSPYVRYVGHLDGKPVLPGLPRQHSHAWTVGATLESRPVTGRLEYLGSLETGARGEVEVAHAVEARISYSGNHSGVAAEFAYTWTNIREPVITVKIEGTLRLGPFEPILDLRIGHTGGIGDGDFVGGVRRAEPTWFLDGRAGLEAEFGPFRAGIRLDPRSPIVLAPGEPERLHVGFFDLFDLTLSMAIESADPPRR